MSGSKIEDQDLLDTLAEPPPVPTTSIFSRTDGICAWQACLNKEGRQIEKIEVNGSHCGLGHHPAVVYAVADRLSQRRVPGRNSTATVVGATLSFRIGGACERIQTRRATGRMRAVTSHPPSAHHAPPAWGIASAPNLSHL